MQSHVIGIILASGASSRMGQNKLALPVQGKAMLQHVLDAAHGSRLRDVLLILPSMEEQAMAQECVHKEAMAKNHAWELALQKGRAVVLRNPLRDLGQVESLKVGIQHILMHAQPAAMGAMVLLGDQPFITSAHIDFLLDYAKASPQAWIIPESAHNGQRGNPVIIPSMEFSRVMDLEGDTGARPLLATSLLEKCFVKMSDTAPFCDIDTPEMYEKYAKEE